jgi:hypothetical protein
MSHPYGTMRPCPTEGHGRRHVTLIASALLVAVFGTLTMRLYNRK